MGELVGLGSCQSHTGMQQPGRATQICPVAQGAGWVMRKVMHLSLDLLPCPCHVLKRWLGPCLSSQDWQVEGKGRHMGKGGPGFLQHPHLAMVQVCLLSSL